MSNLEPASKFSEGFHEWVRSGVMIPPKPQLDKTSITSVQLEPMFNETKLATGTGFFWRIGKTIALITAWHNFSGLHHTERTAISKMGGMPNRVKIRFMSISPKLFHEQVMPLYFDDHMEQPAWHVHPKCGSFFDIAWLNLDLNGNDVSCVNDFSSTLDTHILPGSDVFAIGYPQGISSIGNIPVWKRGTVASEIDLPTEGHPKFLIDMAGRGGLSGAPVYWIQRGTYQTENGFGIGNKTTFIGLYSGRAADQLPLGSRTGESSDLGYVWRRSIVEEAIASQQLDEKPEIGKGKVTMTPFMTPIKS